MGIEEQIARLEVKAVKAEEAWRSERERFERIRAVCDTNAEAICRMDGVCAWHAGWVAGSGRIMAEVGEAF